ncbi:extracellular solute-binding protein [Lachnotalea glycerini]|uniref:Extracellular solute-binding protein n=1 Tax=Lachnotalea glycerini TaxID=1763509 RepID=A0A371JKM4_9FIRM|nr:extracellular solute-binding protein [Lachnotalea glycerini]RDY33269.1 extracellular solute-binding protein [Lachnotalea glycerini]
MKSKLFYILLSVSMLASLLNGCGSSSTSTSIDKNAITETKENSETSIETKETTLTLWSIATESDSFNHAYVQAIEDFQTANPGVTIKMETYENQSYKTKIKSAVAANELPDIFYTWGGGFSKSFIESGKVLPLDDYFTEEYKKQLPQAALTYATYDGKLYGTTFTTPISVLFYNKKLFQENQIEVPETFDNLIDVCATFRGKGITPIGISAKDTWVLAMTHDALTLKYTGPDKLVNALTKNGQSYDDPDFLNSATAFSQLVEMGAFSEGAAGLSNDEATAMFYGEKVAMFISGSFLAGSIQENADHPENFDAVPVPICSDNAKITDFMGGAVDTLMVNAQSQNKDLAAKAAFELARNISKYAYLDGTGVAAWEKDYDDSNVSDLSKKIADYAANATSFTIWFDTLMDADDAGEYLSLLQQLYSADISPNDFTKAMANQLGN